MASRVQLCSLDPGNVRQVNGTPMYLASITVRQANTTNPVIIYQALTGGAQFTQPLRTDRQGRVPGYIAGMQVVDIAVNGNTPIQVQVPDGSPLLADLADGPAWIATIGGLAGLVYPVGTRTATYAIAGSDGILTLDATSAAFTATLPDATTLTGHTFRLRSVITQPNTVTLATTSSQTIDGNTTLTLGVSGLYHEVDVVSDGANWKVIGGVLTNVPGGYAGLDALGRASLRQVGPSINQPVNVLIVGESIAAANNDDYVPGWPNTVPTGRQAGVSLLGPVGSLNHANYLLGKRLRIIKNAGISGASSATILAAIQNPANAAYCGGLNPPPDLMMIQCDSGDDADPPTTSYASSLTSIAAIYDYLLALYPNALAWGYTLPGVAIGTPNNATRRLAINPGIKAAVAARPMRLLDYEAITTDPTTGLPIAGESIEASPNGIHPNGKGALRVGRHIAREFGPYVPQRSMLVTNPQDDPRCQTAQGGWGLDALFLPGAAGVATIGGVTTYDANVANNWQLNGPVGATYSLLPRDQYGYWQRIALPPGLTSTGTVYVDRPLGVFPAGAIIYIEAEIRTHGDFVGVVSWGMSVDTSEDSSIASPPNQMFAYEMASYGTYGPFGDPGPGVIGVLQTLPLKVPSTGITGGSVNILLMGLAGSLDIGRCSLVRVA